VSAGLASWAGCANRAPPARRTRGKEASVRSKQTWIYIVGVVLAGLTFWPSAVSAQTPSPMPPVPAALAGAPKTIHDHVYIYVVNGLDPLYWGDLTGLRDHIGRLGFANVQLCQCYEILGIQSEMRKLHHDDPAARFVLVGFSLGANAVHEIASGVQSDGVTVDLLVFLSGNHPVMPLPRHRPANVLRVVNVLASGVMKYAGERDYAENLRVDGTRHFTLPTHPVAIEALDRGLAAVVQRP
jgi:hypothetical protein